jgi:DNA-binding CsgD family transcriptional regulator
MPDGHVEVLAINTFGPELFAEYLEHFALEDDWVKLALLHGRDRALAADRHMSRAEWQHGRFYNEFLRPNGLGDVTHCVGTIVTLADGGFGAFGIQRDAKRGDFGVAGERLIEQFIPHLKRLMLMRARLSKAERGAQMTSAMFDHLALGVLLLSEDSCVRYANEAATTLLRKGDGLTWSFGEHIGAESRTETTTLRAHVARAAAGSHSGAVLVQRSSGAVALQVLVAPFRPPGGEWTRHALVLVHDPAIEPQGLASTLMQLFDLSAGEARVTVALAEGKSLTDIAQQHGVQVSTVQTQLKRALDKTGQRRQSGLVKVASRAPSVRGPRQA